MSIDVTEITSGLQFLSTLNEEFEDCFSKEEVSLINSLQRLPYGKWNEGFIVKALTLINAYVDEFDELQNLNLDFSIIDKNMKKTKVSFDGKHIIFSSNDKLKKIIGSPVTINNDEYYYPADSIDFANIIDPKDISEYQFDKTVLKYVNLQFNLHKLNINNLFSDNYEHIKKQPMDFQKYGVAFGLLNKKIILADDMGLGKSLQSLIIAEKAQKFPCLIVCPNSLKLNWKKEIFETINRKSVILKNNKDKNNKLIVPEEAEFYITNYESLHNFNDFIEEKNIQFMIFDESHFIKNYKAKRTQTCLNLSKQAEYIIAVTGTPILNRPHELVTQLDLIGKLDDLGGYWGYSQEYCNSKDEKWGWDNSGSSNLKKLSSKLRETCLIRREKHEVLKDLPEKRRAIIPIELSNLKEYNKKLEELHNTPKSEKSKRATLFHECNILSALGKMHELKSFVDEFIISEEKVVIFAKHKKVLTHLQELFPDALRIVEEDNEEVRFENALKFQRDENHKVIICGLEVAYFGFDLYASSNVIFAEFDYVDEKNTQAEDRLCRIGQRNSVNAWYLVADKTNDERILDITQQKKDITDDIKSGFKTYLIEQI